MRSHGCLLIWQRASPRKRTPSSGRRRSLSASNLFRPWRGAPLLEGARGRPAVDVPAAARALAALSRLAAERPEIAEVEINPLLATPGGAVALDARVVLRERGDE